MAYASKQAYKLQAKEVLTGRLESADSVAFSTFLTVSQESELYRKMQDVLRLKFYQFSSKSVVV